MCSSCEVFTARCNHSVACDRAVHLHFHHQDDVECLSHTAQVQLPLLPCAVPCLDCQGLFYTASLPERMTVPSSVTPHQSSAHLQVAKRVADRCVPALHISPQAVSHAHTSTLDFTCCNLPRRPASIEGGRTLQVGPDLCQSPPRSILRTDLEGAQ